MTEDTRTDDGNRGATGLAISIMERPDGKVWLVFDDVRRAGWKAPFQWKPKWFFTRFEVELADLLKHRLDDPVLDTIGLAVVARLAPWKPRPRLLKSGDGRLTGMARTSGCAGERLEQGEGVGARYVFDAWGKLWCAAHRLL